MIRTDGHPIAADPVDMAAAMVDVIAAEVVFPEDVILMTVLRGLFARVIGMIIVRETTLEIPATIALNVLNQAQEIDSRWIIKVIRSIVISRIKVFQDPKVIARFLGNGKWIRSLILGSLADITNT